MAATSVAVGAVPATSDMNDALIERIGSTNITANTAGNATTTAAQVMALSVNLTNGKTYEINWNGRVSGAASDTAVIRIKTVSASGTDLNSTQIFLASANAGGFECSLYAEYTATATAAVNFVVTIERAVSGAGSLIVRASATGPSYLYVDYLGV